MRKTGLFLFCALLGACAPVQTQQGSPLTGGDRDAHGCIASAGYTYAAVQDRCVRLWEDGVRLNPAEAAPAGQAVFSAFAVLSDDGARAELFLPQGGQTQMTRGFTPDGPYWTDKKYRLDRKPEGWFLYRAGKLLYQAPNPPDGAN